MGRAASCEHVALRFHVLRSASGAGRSVLPRRSERLQWHVGLDDAELRGEAATGGRTGNDVPGSALLGLPRVRQVESLNATSKNKLSACRPSIVRCGVASSCRLNTLCPRSTAIVSRAGQTAAERKAEVASMLRVVAQRAGRPQGSWRVPPSTPPALGGMTAAERYLAQAASRKVLSVGREHRRAEPIGPMPRSTAIVTRQPRPR